MKKAAVEAAQTAPASRKRKHVQTTTKAAVDKTDMVISTLKLIPMGMRVSLSRKQFLAASAAAPEEKPSAIACWHDCHLFDWEPCHVPTQYDSINDVFYCTGNFCSWNCAKAYCLDSRSLRHCTPMISNCANRVRKPWIDTAISVTAAASRSTLRMFGGSLEIEEYRQGAIQRNGHLVGEKPGKPIGACSKKPPLKFIDSNVVSVIVKDRNPIIVCHEGQEQDVLHNPAGAPRQTLPRYNNEISIRKKLQERKKQVPVLIKNQNTLDMTMGLTITNA